MSKEETSQPIPESDVPPENTRNVSEPEANEPDREAPEEEQATLEIDTESVADSLAADLDGLQAELEEAQNRALRSSAELENYRRRANRQMAEERRYANIDILRDLLPIWDNMGRAVEAAQKAGETNALLEGFQMVCTQLESVFEKYNCTKLEPTGEPFDPNLHEAISQMPSAEHPAGTVLHVAQIGFVLHDRVVRPCQVVVSAVPPDSNELGSGDACPKDDVATED